MKKSIVNSPSQWSGVYLFCSLVFSLISPAPSFAQAIIDVDKKVPCDFAVKADQNYDGAAGALVVKNMPRVRSQGSTGKCYAYAAATIAQHAICSRNIKRYKEVPEIKSAIAELPVNSPDKAGWEKDLVEYEKGYEDYKNCANLAPENEISPLAAGALSKKNGATISSLDLLDGGSSFNLLRLFQGGVTSEKCYPSDNFVNKYGLANLPLIKAKQDELIRKYDVIVKNSKLTEADILEDCRDCNGNPEKTRAYKALKEIRDFYFDGKGKNTVSAQEQKIRMIVKYRPNIRPDTRSEPIKFHADYFSYVGKLVNEGCEEEVHAGVSANVKMYPSTDASSEMTEFDRIYKRVLSNGSPVVFSMTKLDAYVVDQNDPTAHAVVVSGYHKVGNEEYIKIQNSAGEEWQRQCTNWGWVRKTDLIQKAMRSIGKNSRRLLVWLD